MKKKRKKDLWDKHKSYVNKFVRSNHGSKRAQGAKKEDEVIVITAKHQTNIKTKVIIV